MSEQILSAADFEEAYEQLAAAIDRVGRAQESDFLVRLALLLMQASPDGAAITATIAAAEAAMH